MINQKESQKHKLRSRFTLRLILLILLFTIPAQSYELEIFPELKTGVSMEKFDYDYHYISPTQYKSQLKTYMRTDPHIQLLLTLKIENRLGLSSGLGVNAQNFRTKTTVDFYDDMWCPGLVVDDYRVIYSKAKQPNISIPFRLNYYASEHVSFSVGADFYQYREVIFQSDSKSQVSYHDYPCEYYTTLFSIEQDLSENFTETRQRFSFGAAYQIKRISLSGEYIIRDESPPNQYPESPFLSKGYFSFSLGYVFPSSPL